MMHNNNKNVLFLGQSNFFYQVVGISIVNGSRVAALNECTHKIIANLSLRFIFEIYSQAWHS